MTVRDLKSPVYMFLSRSLVLFYLNIYVVEVYWSLDLQL